MSFRTSKIFSGINQSLYSKIYIIMTSSSTSLFIEIKQNHFDK